MKLFSKPSATIAALALSFVFAGAANAAVVDMNFDAITDVSNPSTGGQFVDQYYNGGCSAHYQDNSRTLSCNGPAYGVTWSNAIVGDTGDANAFWNFAALSPSTPNAIGFLSSTAATMNVAAGFDTGFSFWYTAFAAGSVVLTGTDSSGSWTSTINLAATPLNCTSAGNAVPCWAIESFAIPVGVTVTSVDFGGSANLILFDNITLGSLNPIPEPGALGMFGLGVLLIGGFLGLRKRFS